MCDHSLSHPHTARLVLCQLVDFHERWYELMPMEAIPSMVHGIYVNFILHIYFYGDSLVGTVWYSDKGMGSMAEV